MKHLAIPIVAFLCSISLSGQIDVFLLLEDPIHNKRIKYYQGQRIEFTTTYDPDNWQSSVIQGFSPEEDLLIFNDGYYHVNDIHSIQTRNKGATALSNLIFGFGSSIAVIGGIGYASDGLANEAVGSVAVGGIFVVIGHFIKKLFGKRRHKVKKKFMDLRIIDTRFSVPEDQRAPIRTP